MQTSLIITIDGPAGAGKTTVSKLLAESLGYRYLDTGALYRGVAYAVQDAGINPDDPQAMQTLCRGLVLTFEQSEQGVRLILNGKDITEEIRTPDISMLASAVSAQPLVRNLLLETQRVLGRQKRLVCEGRDMGTVVFPQAEVKFFLDADPRVRASRRRNELKAQSRQIPSLAAVEADIIQRDRNDRTRAIAPLKPAADAIRIDTSRLTAQQVVQVMRKAIQDKVR